MRSGKKEPARPRELFGVALRGSKTLHCSPGETIVAQGDECTDVHYIEDGLVKLTLVSKRGRGAVLGILGKGEFFGEGCIRGESVYLTSAITLVDSTLRVIKRRTMQRLVEEDPVVASRLILHLLGRNQRIEQDLIDHLFNSSEKRLARILLTLGQSETGNGVPSVLESIGQDMLAEMVGTTRSRVNFFMNKFRKLGFIHYNGGLKVYEALGEVLRD
jgi:CRP-like cAMP-binding protein